MPRLSVRQLQMNLLQIDVAQEAGKLKRTNLMLTRIYSKVQVAVVSAMPTLPLVFLVIPVDEILKLIGGALL